MPLLGVARTSHSSAGGELGSVQKPRKYFCPEQSPTIESLVLVQISIVGSFRERLPSATLTAK